VRESVQKTRAAFTARLSFFPVSPSFSSRLTRCATTGQLRHRFGFERQHYFFTLVIVAVRLTSPNTVGHR